MEKMKRLLCGGVLSAALASVTVQASAAGEICEDINPTNPMESFQYFCGVTPPDGPPTE